MKIRNIILGGIALAFFIILPVKAENIRIAISVMEPDPIDFEDASSTLPIDTASTTPTENATTTPAEQQEPPTVPKPAAQNNEVAVVYMGETIFQGIAHTTSTSFVDDSGAIFSTSTITALGVLAEAGHSGNFSINIKNYGYGYYVNAINNITPIGFDGWIYNINMADPGLIGINDYLIKDGDKLTVFYSVWPHKIEANTSTITLGDSIDFTSHQYQNSAWQASPSTTISINQELFVTNASGTYQYTPTATGTVSTFIYGSADWPANSPTVNVEILATKVLDAIDIVSTTTSTPADTIQPTDNPGHGCGGCGASPTPTFSATNAVNYIISQQKDGSWGGFYTDWAVVALASNGQTDILQKTKEYFLGHPEPDTTLNPTADYARRAMAVMSVNINPYNGAGINYIKKITDSFDGTQIGDNTLWNDDIFSLLVLTNAGYGATDPIIASTTKYILSKQQNNSWGSVDMTAAAIQALSNVKNLDGVGKAIEDGKNNLKEKQNADGGFGDMSSNPFSTAWAMQAIKSLGEDYNNWKKENNTPINYLAKEQQTDGGIGKNELPASTRLWATAYAVPAVLNKTWNDILVDFQKTTDPADADLPKNSTNNNTPTIAPTTTTSNSNTTTLNFEMTTTAPTTTVAAMSTTTIAIAPTTTVAATDSTTVITTIAPENSKTNKKAITKKQTAPADTTKIPIKNNNYTAKKEKTTPTDTIADNKLKNDNKEKMKTTIDELPLDTGTKKTAKKILVISGGSALAVGAYIGLRLLKNVI